MPSPIDHFYPDIITTPVTLRNAAGVVMNTRGVFMIGEAEVDDGGVLVRSQATLRVPIDVGNDIDTVVISGTTYQVAFTERLAHSHSQGVSTYAKIYLKRQRT